MRNMLRQYERQLLNARRLARYRMALRLAQGDADPPEPKEIHRRRMVEKVAKELYEHLIFTGSQNPVAETIREELSASAGAHLYFQYTPGEAAMQLIREGSSGPEEVSPHEKARLLDALWHITLAKVDETMW
jgi:alkanesulfonate monooxygenase SsuD/methylene tetrahydromethanopterin reductase-like flavin-dependent oxidoreductase (luciferase family)